MIEIEGLTVKYGRKVALNNLSLNVKYGESLIIMGPNGSGKTTLLKAILGLLRYEGNIRINGKNRASLRKRDLAREIAYIPQVFSTPYSFTVKEFVSMGQYSVTREWGTDEKKLDQILENVGINDLRDKMISTLSGGELQKSIIARALIQDSKFLLMDEPTAHLDIRSVMDILEIVSSLKGKGVILVSHDLNALNKLGGEMALMKRGSMVFKGTKDDSIFNDKIIETFETEIRRIGNHLYFTLE